jgi:putative copper export protein
MAGFVLKILLVSGLISAAIKLVGFTGIFTPNNETALLLVLLPVVAMAIALIWRWKTVREE